MRRRLGAAALLGLAGCATQSVTLLPGEAGHPVGAVAVLNPDGSEKGVIASADTAAGLGGGFHPHALAQGDVDRRYGRLIADLPPPPEHYTLTFDIGRTSPSADQEAVLQRIFAAVAARPGAEVQVVGHTDTVAGPARNDRVSQERAEQVRAFLIARGLAPALVRATWRGERELLVPTADGVAEVRNRRVEVIIR